MHFSTSSENEWSCPRNCPAQNRSLDQTRQNWLQGLGWWKIIFTLHSPRPRFLIWNFENRLFEKSFLGYAWTHRFPNRIFLTFLSLKQLGSMAHNSLNVLFAMTAACRWLYCLANSSFLSIAASLRRSTPWKCHWNLVVLNTIFIFVAYHLWPTIKIWVAVWPYQQIVIGSK